MADSPTKLVAFDMEGCLTDDPTVWEIMHHKLGTWDSHGLPYWDRYRAGELEYDEFARMDVAVWKDAPFAMLQEAAAEVALMPGCHDVLTALCANGRHVAVISNGLECVANRFRQQYGVQHVHANRVVVRDGRLTGEVEIRVPYDRKGDVLCDLASRLGVRCDEVAAVGDSTSDVAMFKEARIGVAFRPGNPSVADSATHHVEEKDLRALLDIL